MLRVIVDALVDSVPRHRRDVVPDAHDGRSYCVTAWLWLGRAWRVTTREIRSGTASRAPTFAELLERDDPPGMGGGS